MTSEQARSEATADSESAKDFVDRTIEAILRAGAEAWHVGQDKMATHVASVLTAIAAAVQDDDPNVIDLQAAYDSLDHVCMHTLEAALFMLAFGARANKLNSRAVIDTIPAAMRVVARSTHE